MLKGRYGNSLYYYQLFKSQRLFQNKTEKIKGDRKASWLFLDFVSTEILNSNFQLPVSI